MTDTEDRNIVITGTSSGLGHVLAGMFRATPGWSVWPVDRDWCDLVNPDAIMRAATQLPSRIDVLINNAGVNYIAYVEDTSLEFFDQVMAVNARAIFLLTQALLPALIAAKGTVCNVISNASHVPMTASIAYNASKGAAHIMTLQLARELTKRYGITVFGISPNKMAGTAMSRYIEEVVPRVRDMTPEAARKYQLASLLTGRETPPERVAELMHWLLTDKARHEFLTGVVIPYGA